MMVSLELDNKKFFLEYGLKVRKKKEVYEGIEAVYVIEKEEFEGLKIFAIHDYEEIAKYALRLVYELFHVHNLPRHEVFKKLKEFYGLTDEDAKELMDYAESYLFNL